MTISEQVGNLLRLFKEGKLNKGGEDVRHNTK